MEPNSRLTLEQVKLLMLAKGARRLFAKVLQANDNSKNQIYLGGDFGALNMLPTKRPEADAEFKLASRRPLRASLDLWWIDTAGEIQPAREAKLILYPQYPEVRLSGFLSGLHARERLSALLGSVRVPGRVLLLGVCDDDRVLGFVDAPDSPLAEEVKRLQSSDRVGIFIHLPLGGVSDASARQLLLDELARIERLGWIGSKRLRADGTVLLPYAGQNGGGYTLEAELGIIPNGRAEPDYQGWEVKQHGVPSFERPGNQPVTLMTPEPSEGLYKSLGVESFVEKYGYPDKKGRAGRRNFGGIHKCGQRLELTGLHMELIGFDREAGKITDVAGGIVLIDDDDVEAAIWRFADLIDHWRRKHASAAFVASMSRTVPDKQYRYGDRVRLGVGTSIDRLLRAMAAGTVYYDPAIKCETVDGRLTMKRRSQFRIKSTDLPVLYDKFEEVSVAGPR